MRTAIVIPVKDPGHCKTRLAALLNTEERRDLAWAMLEDVAGAISESTLARDVFVVTSYERAAGFARSLGFEVVLEERQVSESNSVDHASGILTRAGFDAVLRIPADVPCVLRDDIDELLDERLSPPVALLVPSRDRKGTNAILRAPGVAFQSRFGPNSLALHLQEAESAGVEVRIRECDRLALDIDDPGDLIAFMLKGSGTRTYECLEGLSIRDRLEAATRPAGNNQR